MVVVVVAAGGPAACSGICVSPKRRTSRGIAEFDRHLAAVSQVVDVVQLVVDPGHLAGRIDSAGEIPWKPPWRIRRADRVFSVEHKVCGGVRELGGEAALKVLERAPGKGGTDGAAGVADEDLFGHRGGWRGAWRRAGGGAALRPSREPRGFRA